MRETSSPVHSPTFRDRHSYSNPALDSSLHRSSNPDRTAIYQEQQYASTSTPVAPHSAVHHPVAGPSTRNHLLSRDQRWPSISPPSQHTSIPSPTYLGPQKWIEDEMEQHFGRLSTSSGPIHQQSPIMVRERANHRYYPYPPAAATPHAQSQSRSYDHDMPGTSPLSAYPPQGPNSGGYQHPPSYTRHTFDGNN
jgi:hypothetical protein